MERTEKEIEAQIDAAITDGRSRWPGMSYEEGVESALRWVLGWQDEAPMEEE